MTELGLIARGKFRFLLLCLLMGGSAFADGGSVLFQQTKGKYDVTVFALPTPLRAGPVDISVMIQDKETGAPVLDASVGLSILPMFDPAGNLEIWTPPCCSMRRSDNSYGASREQAQNKLMYHALFPIPAAGEWKLTIELRHRNDAFYFTQAIQVAAPQKPMWTYWPLLLLPVVVAGGFILNRRLRSSV